MSPRVGVVGLGAMGRPIAEHVVGAEFPTTVHDLHPDVSAGHAGRGASVADSPAAVAADSDVVLVVVPSDDDVRAACLDDDGVLAGAEP